MAAAAAPAGLYDALAPLYDAWQSAGGLTPFALVAHAKLEPALERWGRGTVQSFVDLGCGSGELLLALGRAHPRWRLAGVDASAAMLAVAAGKPDAAPIAWLRARLGEPLPLAPRFDAAGAFYDTLNHLPDVAAVARTFQATAEVLHPGGVLIFDLTNALGFDRWWQGGNRWAGAGWSIAVETRYDRTARAGQALVTVAREAAVARFVLTERCFTDDEIAAALEAAGMSVLKTETWSPFSIDAPGKTLWIVRKMT